MFVKEMVINSLNGFSEINKQLFNTYI